MQSISIRMNCWMSERCVSNLEVELCQEEVPHSLDPQGMKAYNNQVEEEADPSEEELKMVLNKILVYISYDVYAFSVVLRKDACSLYLQIERAACPKKRV